MDFFAGENATLYLTVMGDSGPIYTGVSGVTVDVYHFNNSTLVVDVASGTMTNQPNPYHNVWYYGFNVASGAALTSYNALYNAMISGNLVQTSDTFNVFPASAGANPVLFSGSVAVSGTVVNPSGIAIQNVAVSFASGSSIVATTTTNASGTYNAYLNPQAYYTTFIAPGYFTNQLTMTVPSGATAFLGSTTLIPSSTGSLVISDTLVTLDPYGNPIPLSNIKISLWSIDTVGGGAAIGVTFTNVSGTFFLNANPGNYLLSMAGMDVNFNRYNQTRNIEVNSVYNFPPNGPTNFQYLDTSGYNFA